MKYCVIGAGVQGSATAAVLARGSDASSIVVADYDADLANRVVSKIGCKRMTAARVDATDPASVASVAKGCDIILNLTDMDLAPNVRKAALQVGCHYVDSAAEIAFQRDVAFKHHVRDDEAFKAAGLCGVTGAGTAPGISNLLIRRVTDQLDEVAEIYLRIAYPEKLWFDRQVVAHPWLPHWSPEVALKDFSDQSMFFTGGKPTLVGPYANPEIYDFGGRMGKRLITSHSHDESYTLPFFIGKGITECDVRYPVNDQAATLVAMGLGDRDRVVELKDGTKVKPFDVIMAVVKRPVEGAFLSETRESISNARPMDRVIDMEVIGRKDGVAQRTLISWYHDDSPQLRLQLFETFGAVNIWVAVPMVVAAKMISRGQVPKGVVTPEGLDFELFFRELETMEYPLDVQEKCTLLPSA